MSNVLIDKARGSLAGLAIGDALGRPVEGMSATDIRTKYGSVNDFLLMTPGGSDDTEYALLTAKAILNYGIEISSDNFAEFWVNKVCAQQSAFAGAGFSEMCAIENLRNGLKPPFSGQHQHAWSDGLAMRVAPIGIVTAGNLDRCSEMAIADGQVSHSGEGIYSGQVVAIAIAAAFFDDDVNSIFEKSISYIPQDSWTYRNLLKAKKIVNENYELSVHEIADLLIRELAVEEYFYADLAPEAVALALSAVLYGQGDFAKTLLFAVNLGRDADTIAAMAAAIAGAISGYESIPENWKRAVDSVKGTCLEFTAGMNPVEVADELIELITQES